MIREEEKSTRVTITAAQYRREKRAAFFKAAAKGASALCSSEGSSAIIIFSRGRAVGRLVYGNNIRVFARACRSCLEKQSIIAARVSRLIILGRKSLSDFQGYWSRVFADFESSSWCFCTARAFDFRAFVREKKNYLESYLGMVNLQFQMNNF